jgi:Amidase
VAARGVKHHLRRKTARVIELPTIARSSGLPVNFHMTGARQFGQNPRLTVLPLSERMSWNRNSPVSMTVPANYLTLCAATLPVGLDRLGMPVGLQFIAKGGDDERLVAIACAAERVLGTPREIPGAPPMCKG